jgi:DNA helicase HerA-like ATPase
MNRILLGKGDKPIYLLAAYGNRHGLVAGATGTGKTVSLMVIAEGFSRMGVPVFMADVKGDVAGLAMAGSGGEKIQQRVSEIGIEGYAPEANAVVFWDLYGKSGHPVRTTISELGPMLLGRILELSDPQVGALEIAFKLADDRGLLLLDLDDLRALLTFVADSRKEISTTYGLVSAQSIAAIQRGLLSLEREGGESLFGEPALELSDLLRTDLSGRGIINILAADQLILKPRLYSTFLLWLLSELFENLPEVGDLDKPKLVFMFDEAHLLFDDAPRALVERIEQVVRIIRSKGVGVYFCSQFPDDVPGEILGQIGNRVQHALRAFTPRDQKAVKTAAETFPANKKLDVAKVISTLQVGEALVSTLQENGAPMPVDRTLMAPPRSRIGAITSEERATIRAGSPVGGKYDKAVNRESAYEILTRRTAGWPGKTSASGAEGADRNERATSTVNDFLWGTKRRQGMVETMAKQAARTVGSQVGRQILRGVLGGLLGGTRAR